VDNPDARALAAPAWLFGGRGMAVLAALTLAAVVFSGTDIALLAGTLFVVGALTRGWAALALKRVHYGRRPMTRRAFCGDTLELETSLSNRKLLPLPWIEAWERVPRALLPRPSEVEQSVAEPSVGWLRQGAALWSYQRARWRHRLECRRRGAYTLGPAYLRSGDPFSLFERGAEVPGSQELIVYPRVVPLRRLGLALRHPSLDAVGARSLVTDPTRTAALRDYRPGDPRRLIHWPTTARRGELQVRVLEPATSLRVSLVLDVRSWRFYGDAPFETAVSALASIAVYLQEGGWPFALLANTDPPLVLSPGSDAAHLERVLEALARVEPVYSRPLVPWALEHLPYGMTTVLAASDLVGDLAATLSRLAAAGQRVTVLLGGTRPLPALPAHTIRLDPTRDLAAILEGGP
jgi:uncharacterized protein (DUF58 family)